MPAEIKQGSDRKYLNVLGGSGELVQNVPKGTDGSRYREVVNKKTGERKDKYEIVYDNISGVVHGLKFKDGEYGRQLQVDFGDYILCMNTDSEFFASFVSKFLNCDMTKPIWCRPYAFTPNDSDKKKRGMTVMQDGKKIGSKFWNPEKGGKPLHGYPEVDENKKDKMGANYWTKSYFPEVELFLVDQITALELKAPTTQEPPVPTPTDDLYTDDLPF